MAALTALVEESKGRRRGRADMASLNKRNADMNFKARAALCCACCAVLCRVLCCVLCAGVWVATLALT